MSWDSPPLPDAGEEGAEFRNSGLGHAAGRDDTAECFSGPRRHFRHSVTIDFILKKRCEGWTIISTLLWTKTSNRMKYLAHVLSHCALAGVAMSALPESCAPAGMALTWWGPRTVGRCCRGRRLRVTVW